MRTRLPIVVALAAALLAVGCSPGSALTGKTWLWASMTSKTPVVQAVVPAEVQANYTIEFKSDGSFGAKADCNAVGGTYTTTSGGAMTIVPGPSTLVLCPQGSMDVIYMAGLTAAANYRIEAGALTITTTEESTLTFK